MKALLNDSVLRHVNAFSLYMLYCTALFYFSNSSLGAPTYRLFLISSIISLLFSSSERWRNFALLAIAASVVVQVSSWAYSLSHHPGFAEPDPNFKRLTSLLLFVPVAWTLYANRRRPWFLLSVFFVGLCVVPFTKGDGLEEFSGNRSDFGMLNAQHSAMVFSIALLALLVFSKRILASSTLSRNATVAIYLAAVLYCVAIVVLSNTRGVFLGLLLAFVVALVFGFRYRFFATRRNMALVVVSVLLIGVGMIWGSDRMLDRWEQEAPDLNRIASGDLDAISKRSSSGIRLHSWAEGWDWFLDNPVLGWGANGMKLVIKQSNALPEDLRKGFGHLHNSFLEVLVNNGLMGLVFLLSIYYWLWRYVFAAGERALDQDVRLFAASACCMWLVANCFESYMFYKSGVMVFGVVAGSLMSLGMFSSGESAQKPGENVV